MEHIWISFIYLYCLSIDIVHIIYTRMSYAYLYCLNTNVVYIVMLFTHESRAHDFCVYIMHNIFV